MDDFADLLKFIVPLVIFLGAAIFGKSDKQKAGQKHTGQSGFNAILDLIDDETETADIPHTVHYSNDDRQPQPSQATEPQQPVEGERAVFVESHDDTVAEPEKPVFDARTAVIYSTILERKY
jgi:hypothetical protein